MWSVTALWSQARARVSGAEVEPVGHGSKTSGPAVVVRGPADLRPRGMDRGEVGRPEPGVASDIRKTGQVTSPLGALRWVS